ncbi:MAG: hypothetical protein HFI75_07660 [Lachnospiraceae bacterium]|nr:hypothetical protein [Lachnospiraceae bacterium]
MIGLIIFGICLLALAGTIWYFYWKIKRFARQNLGVDNLSEFAASQEELMANTPKSVSGMTSLYLPRLQADFPELNWVEFRSAAEKHLLEHLNSQPVTSPHIHQTELRDYRKNSGTCYTIFQSAVEYYKEDKKIQSRFNTVMAYIQDAAKTGYEESYSVNCPNCGAPVTQLGHKICAYCGSAIAEVNMRIWTLDRIEEL